MKCALTRLDSNCIFLWLTRRMKWSRRYDLISVETQVRPKLLRFDWVLGNNLVPALLVKEITKRYLHALLPEVPQVFLHQCALLAEFTLVFNSFVLLQKGVQMVNKQCFLHFQSKIDIKLVRRCQNARLHWFLQLFYQSCVFYNFIVFI